MKKSLMTGSLVLATGKTPGLPWLWSEHDTGTNQPTCGVGPGEGAVGSHLPGTQPGGPSASVLVQQLWVTAPLQTHRRGH
jgi:hypothetical protein